MISTRYSKIHSDRHHALEKLTGPLIMVKVTMVDYIYLEKTIPEPINKKTQLEMPGNIFVVNPIYRSVNLLGVFKWLNRLVSDRRSELE